MPQKDLHNLAGRTERVQAADEHCWAGAWHTAQGARNRGIVLMLTLVLLLVLATMGYTLTVRVAAARHRNNYLIDYQVARYACDSATKYAMQTFNNLSPRLISRPNEPDFSDMFTLNDTEMREFLMRWAQWAAANEIHSRMFGDANDPNADEDDQFARNSASRTSTKGVSTSDLRRIEDMINSGQAPDLESLLGGRSLDTRNRDANELQSDPNLQFDSMQDEYYVDFNDPNFMNVPGPYGPPWPLTVKPMDFEIGTAKVTVEIEDENAKYPVGWLMLEDEDVERPIRAGFETFCEWMATEDATFDIELLQEQFEQVKQIKPFSMEYKPIKFQERQTVNRVTPADNPATDNPAAGNPAPSGSRTATRGRTRTTTSTRMVTKSLPASLHTSGFARLCHSPLIDAETLAMPTVESSERRESLLKYMGMWGTRQVNINTAPRHVLEAAFSFGGEADDIAEKVIRERQKLPFKDVADLRKRLFSYSSNIEKCEKYITAESSVFTIRISAVSGVAKVDTVIAVEKEVIAASPGAAATPGQSARTTGGKAKQNKMNIIAVLAD